MTLRETALKSLHIGFLIHHSITSIYAHFFVDYNKTDDYRVQMIQEYRIRYLTTWNFVVQMIFLTLAVTIDYLPMNHKSLDLLERIKGYIFNTFLVPGTLVVTTMFWVCFNIDREWVYPEVCDEVFPSWLNHASHTNIVGVVLVEYLLGKSVLPSFKSAFIGLSTITLAYDSLYLYTFFSAGRWLYSIYYLLNWQERIVFMIMTYVVSVLILKGNMVFQHYKHAVNSKSLKVC